MYYNRILSHLYRTRAIGSLCRCSVDGLLSGEISLAPLNERLNLDLLDRGQRLSHFNYMILFEESHGQDRLFHQSITLLQPLQRKFNLELNML